MFGNKTKDDVEKLKEKISELYKIIVEYVGPELNNHRNMIFTYAQQLVKRAESKGVENPEIVMGLEEYEKLKKLFQEQFMQEKTISEAYTVEGCRVICDNDIGCRVICDNDIEGIYIRPQGDE